MAARRPITSPPVVDLDVLARSTDWIDAAPFRAHLRRLVFDGGEHWRVVALACGVAPATVRRLLDGRPGSPLRRIRARDAVLLLGTDRTRLLHLAAAQVPAADTARRVATLRALGHSPVWIAGHLRVPPGELGGLADSSWCSALVELRAACACQAAGLTGWWSGDPWFDDADRPHVSQPDAACTPSMPDLAA